MRIPSNKIKTSLILGAGLCLLNASAMASGKGNYALGKWKNDEGASDHGISVTGAKAAKRVTKLSGFSELDDTPKEAGEAEWDESVSTLEYGQTQARLIDDPDLIKHVKRLYLNITPKTYSELAQHAQGFVKKGLFNRFDGGVWIKAEEGEAFDLDPLLQLTRTLHNVTKYRVSMNVSRLGESGIDLIAESVCGFKRLIEIDLSGCSLTDTHFREILPVITSPGVEEINVSGNRLTKAIVPLIQQKFKRLTRLESDFEDGDVIKVTHTLKNANLDTAPSYRKEDPEIARERERLAAEKQAFEHDKRAFEQRQLEMKAQETSESERKRIQAERETLNHQQKQLADQKKVMEKAEAKRASDRASETQTIQRIPDIARGHEEVYRRFINGRLVYKGPAGERSFLIADVINSSFEGEFNLSGLTYTYSDKTYNVKDDLRIKLGYRKSVENEEKLTVWLAPKFVAGSGNSPFKNLKWGSDVGIFWTWGEDGLGDFYYLTSMRFDEISSKNLQEVYRAAAGAGLWVCDARLVVCIGIREFFLYF